MNQRQTSNEKSQVNTRPLFSSTWLALFSVLRMHYNGEAVVTPARSRDSQLTRKTNPGLNLHSI